MLLVIFSLLLILFIIFKGRILTLINLLSVENFSNISFCTLLVVNMILTTSLCFGKSSNWQIGMFMVHVFGSITTMARVKLRVDQWWRKNSSGYVSRIILCIHMEPIACFDKLWISNSIGNESLSVSISIIQHSTMVSLSNSIQSMAIQKWFLILCLLAAPVTTPHIILTEAV